MASNDQWPPVAPVGKPSGKNRSNVNPKKPTKEDQQQVLSGLTEMFQNTLESEVILSVANSCNWELQSCIDALIAISSTVEPQSKSWQEGRAFVSQDLGNQTESYTQEIETDFYKMNETELQKQKNELKKFEKIKKTSSKNRMGSFRGNISKLGSNYREKSSSAIDSIWDLSMPQSKTDTKYWRDHSDLMDAQFGLPQNPQSSTPWAESLKETSTTPLSQNPRSQILSDKNPVCNQNKPKKESELCGLKVQYRTAGMESSSDDDDADVVIEEELNCIIPTSIPVNVSQLLSSSIQIPPQVACSYKTETISTPSPPRTPKRSAHQAIIDRIKRTITSGDKIMILIRGLPGSGKSTLAKSLISSTVRGNSSDYIFSADDYFVALGRGIYMYDPRKLSDAHTVTQKRVYEALNKGQTPVIVDNTNTQAWEMRPYAALAVKYGYIVEVVESDTPWAKKPRELASKNTHGVPKDKIEQMLLRFEPDITGEKLLATYSLRYEARSDPRVAKIQEKKTNEDEGLSVDVERSSSTPIAINHRECSRDSEEPEENKKIVERDNLEESSENDKYKPSPEAKHFLQVFGAIGSERKNSVASTDVMSIPDPVHEEANVTNEENISSHCSEMQEQDEEFGKKGKRNGDDSWEELKDGDNGVRSAVHNFLSELTQGYNSTAGGFVRAEPRQSTVIITELFEEQEIENVEDIAISLLEGAVDDTDLSKQVENIEEEKCEIIKDGRVSPGHEELSTHENETLIEDEKIENSSGEDKDLSFIDAENLSDVETAEESTEPQAQSTLGTIFNIIKTSILGNTQEEEQLINAEIEQGKELKEFSILEEPKLETNSEPNEKSELTFIDDTKVFKSPIAEIRAAINSTDNDVLLAGIKCNDKNDESEFYSLGNESSEVSKTFSLEGANPCSSGVQRPEEVPDGREEDISIPVDNPNSTVSGEFSKQREILDNINRITWKESPFPIDDLLLPKLSPPDNTINQNIQKQDASTNTSYYDFNVSYIGGTSEPMYRVIPAFNRLINEGVPNPKPERPPLKLMLDKGSMTGDIFFSEGNPEVEDADAKKDRFPELMELFPHIPRDYLVEIYEKVNEDLDWAVELLLEGGTENIIIKMAEENPVLSEEASRVEKEEDNFTSNASESVKSSSPILSSSSPSSTSPEDLRDEMDEEEENDIEEATALNTPELMKDVPADLSDDAASTSTTSISRLESMEDEKSSETEDLVELNLGFDCIKALEQTLGIPNFHIPESFSPVIQIKKSLAEELYASWIESLYHQANTRHEQLDQMMAKDAELARSLERRMELEGASASDNYSEPNLEQIMDMELALAKYKNELKSIVCREAPDDLAARLSRQMLNEAMPDIDPDTFNEILKAHSGNFKEAFEVIEINTGKAIVPCDTLKKQKILMDKVKEEDRNLREQTRPIIVVRTTAKDDRLGYNNALAYARDSREEAQRQLSLKIQNYNKAAEAYRKGCPGVAAYYSGVARLHTQNIDAAHAAAASAFAEAQSWDNEEILDLHNLFVSEALKALDEFLEYHLDKLMRSNKRSSKIYIITGRGARSNNGTSKIKPAVSQKLTSRNIKFSEANPGCLKITLYRKNGTTD